MNVMRVRTSVTICHCGWHGERTTSTTTTTTNRTVAARQSRESSTTKSRVLQWVGQGYVPEWRLPQKITSMTSTRISIQTYNSGSDNGEGTVHPGLYCAPIFGSLKMSSVSPREPAISRRGDQSIRSPIQTQHQHLLPAPDS